MRKQNVKATLDVVGSDHEITNLLVTVEENYKKEDASEVLQMIHDKMKRMNLKRVKLIDKII